MFIVNRILFVFNVMAILGLLASYLAPFITPEFSWQIAFLGLAYPAILGINILFIVYWAVFLKLRFMFSLAAIIIGWSYVPRFIQLKAKKTTLTQENMLQVMTFNTHYFGANDGPEVRNDDDAFFEKIEKINPDVLCLQEVFSGTSPDIPVVNRFIKMFNGYHKANIGINNGRWATDNIAFLSRYPIVKHGVVEHDQSSGNYTIFADIKKENDTIRVICTHLQSIGFEKKQYEAVQNLKHEIDSVELSQYRKIASKIKMAFLLRSKQADAIREFIEKSPHPVIVCGDFNDSPTSYAYRTIRGDMSDAFMEAGSGLGRTYVGPMPSLRIDYILGDPSFQFFNYYSKSFDFSDHKMVSCTVKIK